MLKQQQKYDIPKSSAVIDLEVTTSHNQQGLIKQTPTV